MADFISPLDHLFLSNQIGMTKTTSATVRVTLIPMPATGVMVTELVGAVTVWKLYEDPTVVDGRVGKLPMPANLCQTSSASLPSFQHSEF